MRKFYMLLLAAPILACGPIDPSNPDVNGGNNTFEATLSPSITDGVPNGTLKVDDEVVCTDCRSHDYKVHTAGVYEVTSEVANSLCVPKTVEVNNNGDRIPANLLCGLAPNGTYVDRVGRETDFSTSVVDGKVIMHGFMQDIDCEVNGNTYFCENIRYTGDREVFEGQIANDLCSFTYHAQEFDPDGNLTAEAEYDFVSTDC